MQALREIIQDTLLKIAKDFNSYATWHIPISPAKFYMHDEREVFELRFIGPSKKLIIQFFDDCSYEVYNENGEMLVKCDRNNQTNEWDEDNDHYGLMEVFWQSDVIRNIVL